MGQAFIIKKQTKKRKVKGKKGGKQAHLLRSQRRVQTPERKGHALSEKGASEICRDYTAVSYALNNDIQEMEINIQITFG